MRILTPILIALAFPIVAAAGTATITASGKDKAVQPVECVPDPLDTIIATTDYGFHQDLKRGSGNIEVEHNNFELDRRIPINLFTWPNAQCGQWFLRLGAEYERFDFSLHNETRLPDTLQSISGVIALEYLVNDQTAVLIETHPGVYFQHKINSGSFNSPTIIATALPVFGGDKFYLVSGVALSSLARYPVFPIGGILLHISDKWDLRAYLPDPRIVYQYSNNLEFWTGGELVVGSYKTDNRNVTPVKLSGATLTYDEIRVGAGITWKAKPLTLNFGAGYTVESDADYNRAGLSFETHPAPYVRLTARLDF